MKDELLEAAREFIANEIKDAPVAVIIQFSDLTTRICADFARQHAEGEVRRERERIAGRLRALSVEIVSQWATTRRQSVFDAFVDGLEAQGEKQ